MTYFNSEFALTQLNGNNELLCRLLTKFNTDYGNAQQDIQTYLDSNNTDSASLLIHTIKGVAGNLGMIQLHELASAFEPKCKNAAATASEIADFGTTMTATIAAIKHFIDTEFSPQAALPQDANTEQVSQSLESVLEKNQFIPPNKLAQYMQNLELEPNKKEDLVLAIQQLNYAAALTLLRSVNK